MEYFLETNKGSFLINEENGGFLTFNSALAAEEYWENNKESIILDDDVNFVNVVKKITKTEAVNSFPVPPKSTLTQEIEKARETYGCKCYSRINVKSLVEENYDCTNYAQYSLEYIDTIEKILMGYDNVVIAISNDSNYVYDNHKFITLLTDFLNNDITLRGTFIPGLKGKFFKDLPEEWQIRFENTAFEVRFYPEISFDKGIV